MRELRETGDQSARWRWSSLLLLSGVLLAATSCHRRPDPTTLHFLIESSPNNLDLRQGTDAQSERIGELIFDPLVRKDEHFNLQPWLAVGWQQPDARTWIFDLRPGVRFHDGHVLSSADVAWSIRSLASGSLLSPKAGAFAAVDAITTPTPLRLILHTRTPDPSLLFNLSDGLFGVVEAGAGRDEGLHPVGTGPFRFVSQVQDKDVVLERNPEYWAGAPSIPRVDFEVVPDTITTALEIEKGSGDVESNVLTLDMVQALRRRPGLRIETGPGAPVIYANFNVRDPVLRDPRVRQAIACALDKPALIAALWRGLARPAETLLPPGHWAAANVGQLPGYPHDVQRAGRLLDAAGLPRRADGLRFRFTLKTSSDETTLLLAQAVQAQLREVGIDLRLRSTEFGTFYADITRGAFQMYILRWIGSNEDPDIFRYTYGSGSFPPRGANRGRYSNPKLDALLAEAAESSDPVARRALYVRVQQILASDLPGLPLWYPDNVIVHTSRLSQVELNASGSFDFLRHARLSP